MRLLLKFALPACLVLHGAASAGAQAAADRDRMMPPIVRQYRDLARREFSGERAREVVAYMERWFRHPGNSGFDSSLTHVEAILRRAGYVEQAGAPAGARLTYRIERKPMRGPAWDPLDAELSIVGEAAPLLRWATNRNMLAIQSYSTPPGGIVADVVDVGAGGARFDSVSVTGKIVLATMGLGRTFQEAVVKRGALGVLTYAMPAYTQPETHTNSIQFGSIANDTVRRSFGIALSNAAYTSLRRALAKGPTRVRVRVATRFFPSEERTLIADVRGTERPDERFVLSAHVQEPGANDNASGVGALAEMARLLAAGVRGSTLSPRRSITMIFGNEIAQTQDYLAADSVRTRGVRWGMSLDMVGEDTRKTGGTFLIEKMPDPSAVWTRGEDRHTDWGGQPLKPEEIRPHYYNDFVLARCRDQAEGSDWIVRTNPYEGGSDHVPFLRAGKPGVLLWHFTDVFYHTDGDRLENVSAPELKNAGICALLTALTLTSADGPTTRALVYEVQRAAEARIATEAALSRAAMVGGGDASRERTILRAWTDYYRDAIRAMRDIEVGGSSNETIHAIDVAAERVSAAGSLALRQIP
jgi:aminopeptidase YwaD